jgi:hypothetical protein
MWGWGVTFWCCQHNLNFVHHKPFSTTPLSTDRYAMEAHTCRHCNTIVIDLPDPESFLEAVNSTLCFDVETVKNAVQDGCTFFQWALAMNAEDLTRTHEEFSLDDHIANLSNLASGDTSTDEDASTGDEDSSIEKEDATSDDEDVSREVVDASNEDEDAGSFPERVPGVESDKEDPSHTTGELETLLQSKLDATLGAPPLQLNLYVEACGNWPRRCLLQRDMTLSSRTRPRNSIYWDGPQLDLVAPKGMSGASPA